MSSRFPQSLSVRTKEEKHLMWSQTFSISLFVERRCNPKNTNQRKSDSNVKALLYCGNQNMQLLFWRRVWAAVGECLQTCQQSQTSVGQRPLYSWFHSRVSGKLVGDAHLSLAISGCRRSLIGPCVRGQDLITVSRQQQLHENQKKA